MKVREKSGFAHLLLWLSIAASSLLCTILSCINVPHTSSRAQKLLTSAPHHHYIALVGFTFRLFNC